MIFTKLFKHTTIYKLYNFIRQWRNYSKINRTVGKTFYSPEFNLLISKYLKVNLREDWIGRLYGVINPTIDINGNIDLSSMVIELDGNNSNSRDWTLNWVYKQLRLVAQLFKIEQLYDYINLDIKHVGPENLDNYLVVFDLVSRKEFANATKAFFKSLFFWGSLVGIFFIFNAIFHFL